MHDAEYQALRATIRERGTARMVLFPVVIIGWAAVAVATSAVITTALSTVLPLLVLSAGFESIFALHVNVERVGRYLQVFHERDAREWEHVAMDFGRQFPGSGPDPLFGRMFVFAISINFLPVALGAETWEIFVLAAIHLVAVFRVRTAQMFAATQRAEDLKKFESLTK